MCLQMGVSTGAHGTEGVESPGVGVIGHMIWALETELRSSARVGCAVKC